MAGRGGVLRARAPLAAVVALGAGLRLFYLTSLSLWVDEGLTVRFARLPWAALLGRPTAYGIHPPLYYMAVKLLALLAPETVAGRLVSAVAGTLTIVVLYALASRLVPPRAASRRAPRGPGPLPAAHLVFPGGAPLRPRRAVRDPLVPRPDRGAPRRAALLGAVALTLAVGLAVLARWSSTSLTAAVGLLAGTVAVAVGIGLVYPSFAERTILPVVLGLAIVVGAAASASNLPRGLFLLGGLGAASVLAASLVTIGALDTDAYKQRWDLLAADTAAAARLVWPVVSYPTVAATLIDLYQPSLRGRALLSVDDGGNLPALDDANDGHDEAVWLAYVPAAGIARLQSQLVQQGYARILHTYYPYPLYLDLYARADARLGRDVAINGRFTGTARHATGWFLMRPAAAFEDEEGGRRLALTAAGGAETIASSARVRPARRASRRRRSTVRSRTCMLSPRPRRHRRAATRTRNSSWPTGSLTQASAPASSPTTISSATRPPSMRIGPVTPSARSQLQRAGASRSRLRASRMIKSYDAWVARVRPVGPSAAHALPSVEGRRDRRRAA